MCKQFVEGKLYTLKPKYVSDFNWNFASDQNGHERNKPFTMRVDKLLDKLVVSNGVAVAVRSDCKFFKKINPFKAGETYELKAEFLDDFFFDECLCEELGLVHPTTFQFTVDYVDDCNGAFVNQCYIAMEKERHMFKRVSKHK